MSTNSACTRRSPVISGWNAVASIRPLPHGHGMSGGARQHLDAGPDPLHPRRPDEHRVHRTVEPVEHDVILERIDLTAKGVAAHRHIDRLQRRGLASGNAGIEDLGGQQDHPGT